MMNLDHKVIPKADDHFLVVIQVRCENCTKQFEFEATAKDYNDWRRGVLIQNAMPYLTDEQRELLVSGTGDCCFPEEEEWDDDWADDGE